MVIKLVLYVGLTGHSREIAGDIYVTPLLPLFVSFCFVGTRWKGSGGQVLWHFVDRSRVPGWNMLLLRFFMWEAGLHLGIWLT